MIRMIEKLAVIAALLAGLWMLTACNSIHGAGQAISWLGSGISNDAAEVHRAFQQRTGPEAPRIADFQ